MSVIPDFRTALHKLYSDDGKCSVFVTRSGTDLNGGETDEEEEMIFDDIPCRLSHGSTPASSGGIVSDVSDETTLILDPEYLIPEGSRIVVTQEGVTDTYINSGKPRVYKSSQQIKLTLYDKKA